MPIHPLIKWLSLTAGIAVITFFVCLKSCEPQPDRLKPADNSIQVASDSIKTNVHVVHDHTAAYEDSLAQIVKSLKQQIINSKKNTDEQIRNAFRAGNIDSLDRFLSGQYDSLARTRFAGYR